MALYKPDYKYLEARKAVESLSDDGKDALIKYYIKKHEEWHEEDQKKIKEYQEVFSMIDKFLPSNRSGKLKG